ncbi:MAG: S-layer homology domain-containing protein [Candidatus Sericytochromatia bacterium]|nr:S-layer homology domain-containing protein [Candidatus Sericytochromatia bacterium]
MKPWIPTTTQVAWTLSATCVAWTLTAGASPQDFVDLIPQEEAATAVLRVVGAGIINGYPDHTYRGWKPVSRYELIASTIKLLPQAPPAVTSVPSAVVSDVAATHWAYPAVCQLGQRGLGQQLWSDGFLAGDKPATRFDLAYLATQTLQAWALPGGNAPGVLPYTDVTAGHWATPAVRQVHDLGLMDGLSKDQFGGEETIDRYQLAVVLDRLMARVPIVKAPSPAANPVKSPSPALTSAVDAAAAVSPSPTPAATPTPKPTAKPTPKPVKPSAKPKPKATVKPGKPPAKPIAKISRTSVKPGRPAPKPTPKPSRRP